MSDFLDKLRSGMQEAQQKFVVSQQKFNAAQAESQGAAQRLAVAQQEYQVAATLFQAFQTLVNSQTRKEQQAAGTVTAAPPLPINVPRAAISIGLPSNTATQQNVAAPQAVTDDNKTESSKTQAVRDLLRQHPTGMTPAEIWKQLEAKMSNRAYLYSVLKRLRDKGDARERRGKYFLNPDVEESQAQTAGQ
jgi:hypothetical protein